MEQSKFRLKAKPKKILSFPSIKRNKKNVLMACYRRSLSLKEVNSLLFKKKLNPEDVVIDFHENIIYHIPSVTDQDQLNHLEKCLKRLENYQEWYEQNKINIKNHFDEAIQSKIEVLNNRINKKEKQIKIKDLEIELADDRAEKVFNLKKLDQIKKDLLRLNREMKNLNEEFKGVEKKVLERSSSEDIKKMKERISSMKSKIKSEETPISSKKALHIEL